MSNWTMATADKFRQSAINASPVTRTSPVDTWIGIRLRIKRTMAGLNQQEFSKLSGIDQNDLADFETGAKRIHANLLFRFAKSLDVRPDYFFRDYVEEAPKA